MGPYHFEQLVLTWENIGYVAQRSHKTEKELMEIMGEYWPNTTIVVTVWRTAHMN